MVLRLIFKGFGGFGRRDMRHDRRAPHIEIIGQFSDLAPIDEDRDLAIATSRLRISSPTSPPFRLASSIRSCRFAAALLCANCSSNSAIRSAPSPARFLALRVVSEGIYIV
jgi:hypothetical protein